VAYMVIEVFPGREDDLRNMFGDRVHVHNFLHYVQGRVVELRAELAEEIQEEE
jgi:hypothetical protein